MLCVSAYTHKHRPYSATLYPTSFTLDSPLVLGICAQCKTRGLGFTSGPRLWRVCCFSCVCIFWDERGGDLTLVGPQVDTATSITVLSTNRVDSGSLSHGVVRSGEHIRAQTVFGYFVSD